MQKYSSAVKRIINKTLQVNFVYIYIYICIYIYHISSNKVISLLEAYYILKLLGAALIIRLAVAPFKVK